MPPIRGRHYEVIYTWPDGRRETRYMASVGYIAYAKQVRDLHRAARKGGQKCPYSIRRI